MTDLEKELEAIKKKQAQAVEHANQLAHQRQETLQEILKLAGEQRAVERLVEATKEQ